MPTKAWGIIYCPKEGSPRTHKRWKKIKEYIEECGVSYDFVQSEGEGSVERLASMMTRIGYNTIIVVGGDAALNHTLCGIMQSTSPNGKHPALGVIPNGFGNDFAKYWGFSVENYKKTIESLICRRVRKIDVGKAEIIEQCGDMHTLFFLNCINLGIASTITNLRRKTSSLLGLKTLSYFFSAFLLVFQRKSFHFDFNINGEDIKTNAMGICIGSAHSYGQTPSAVPYNGMLDITLVSKSAITQLIHGVWLLFKGRFLSHKGIKVWRTQRLHITSMEHAILSADGRVHHKASKSVNISILPEEIDFLI